VLNKKEKRTLSVLLVVFTGSFLYLTSFAYQSTTVQVPSQGGKLVEGMVGSPRFLNPLYDATNDVDRSLTQLIFSGLLAYDNTGKLVSDLATEYEVLSEGKVYEVNLKENVRWHDGYAFDADDVIFTIQTIQDPRYKSPVRANWVGVDVQKISQYKVRFLLQDPYAGFAERMTLKILPEHVWEDVVPENFALSLYNLQPVGTGPYRLVDLERNRSGAVQEVRLKAHTKYHLEGPYIAELVVKFFSTQEEAIVGAETGIVQALAVTSVKPEQFRNQSLKSYEFSLPRSFSVFFNLQSNSPVAKESVRKALAVALDRETLNQEVFDGKATSVSSLLRPDLFLFEATQAAEKDIEQAFELLKKEGYKLTESNNLVRQASSSDFTADLRRGNQGTEVTALQECLAQDSSVYPEGIVNGVFGPATETAVKAFQEKYAADILAPSQLTSGTGTVGPSTRVKLRELCSAPQEGTPLTLQLTTLDMSPLKEVASFLAVSWQELGITTEVVLLPSGELERDVLKPRNFEMLLFGEILSSFPDPLPFRHSLQIQDPGLNLSGYENSQADTLLEQIRKTSEKEARNSLLSQLDATLEGDLPTIALYDLPLRYVVKGSVKGIEGQLLSEPSQRLSGIANWYITTKRVWK